MRKAKYKLIHKRCPEGGSDITGIEAFRWLSIDSQIDAEVISAWWVMTHQLIGTHRLRRNDGFILQVITE